MIRIHGDLHDPGEPHPRQAFVARALAAAGLAMLASASGAADDAASAASASAPRCGVRVRIRRAAPGATALRAHFDSLHERLANSQFGRPLVLDSTYANDRLVGEVYARIDQPFPVVQKALQGTQNWCSILILHLNVKRCHPDADGLDMALGRKYDQPADQAYKLRLRLPPRDRDLRLPQGRPRPRPMARSAPATTASPSRRRRSTRRAPSCT